MFCESFSDKVIEHFMCPRNAGSIPDADGIGNCGDPSCGDSLTLYIKVKDNVITDISFLVYGCVAAIATSSMTTELAKGKTLEEAYQITEEDIVNVLGGLPYIRPGTVAGYKRDNRLIWNLQGIAGFPDWLAAGPRR